MEDSPFISSDGQTFYFFFTPDARKSANQQLGDQVTGIWESQRTTSGWGEPTRIWLELPNQSTLDGCPFIHANEMWFCSIRPGNLGSIDLYIAYRTNGVWGNWKDAGQQINLDYQVSEMQLSADGQELFFASQRPGGFGGDDLWVSRRAGDGWSTPVNLGSTVNTSGDENRPFVTADGQELWFDAPSSKGRPGPAVYRSQKQVDGSWGPRQEIISTFGGEPTVSPDGRVLYFVHHFFYGRSKTND